jgi:hypothetical protein
MKNTNEKTLKQAIEELVRAYGLNDKLLKTQVEQIWEEIVGKDLAKHTGRIDMDKSTLKIEITSSALRHELSFSKTIILERLNERLGKKIITEILFY